MLLRTCRSFKKGQSQVQLGPFTIPTSLTPNALHPVDFETASISVHELHNDYVKCIHDARLPPVGLGKFGWLGDQPLVPLDNPLYQGAQVVAINPGAPLWERAEQLLSLGLRWAKNKYAIGRPLLHVALQSKDELDAALLEEPDTKVMLRPDPKWEGSRPLIPPQARYWMNLMLEKSNNLMYCVAASEYPWELEVHNDGEIPVAPGFIQSTFAIGCSIASYRHAKAAACLAYLGALLNNLAKLAGQHPDFSIDDLPQQLACIVGFNFPQFQVRHEPSVLAVLPLP